MESGRAIRTTSETYASEGYCVVNRNQSSRQPRTKQRQMTVISQVDNQGRSAAELTATSQFVTEGFPYRTKESITSKTNRVLETSECFFEDNKWGGEHVFLAVVHPIELLTVAWGFVVEELVMDAPRWHFGRNVDEKEKRRKVGDTSPSRLTKKDDG